MLWLAAAVQGLSQGSSLALLPEVLFTEDTKDKEWPELSISSPPYFCIIIF